MTNYHKDTYFSDSSHENEHPEAREYRHAYLAGHFNWNAAKPAELNGNDNKPAVQQADWAPKLK